MEATGIRLFIIEDPGSTKAIGSFQLDGQFTVRGVRVMEDKNGELFVSFPSREKPDGEYEGIAYPATRAFKRKISEAILEDYHVRLENRDRELEQGKSPEEDFAEFQDEVQTQDAPKARKGKGR
ncbi:MAG: SpoVG family protein [Lachnospiraceae bacterium]|nr:SpoVG family protein [Lachnospiraceae bacterium]